MFSDLNINNSTHLTNRKQPLSYRPEEVPTSELLKLYLSLGLTPIPLKGKVARVKWMTGWHPTNFVQLQSFIGKGTNWGVKTGAALSVIDFDSKQAYIDFVIKNIEVLGSNYPVIKTGRGYHIWFKPTKEIRNKPLDGIDIKGEGGYVVAPGSTHPDTGRKYVFIRPPQNGIPYLDIDTLDWTGTSKVKVKVTKIAPPSDAPESQKEHPSTFDWNAIGNGVKEGGRHSALVQYIGSLIATGRTEEEITEIIYNWNLRNQPPLDDDELIKTLLDLWKRYGEKRAQEYKRSDREEASVATNTMQKPIVLFATKPPSGSIPNALLKEYPASEYAWATEEVHANPHVCGKTTSVFRKERSNFMVVFFCGRRDCPRCGPKYKEKWVNHLLKVTSGIPLYQITLSEKDWESDWNKIRVAVGRAKSQYFTIRANGSVRLILDKQIRDSQPFTDKLDEFLDENIAAVSAARELTFTNESDEKVHPPITTSRGWRRAEPKKSNIECVKIGNYSLPPSVVLAAAQDIGASIKSKYSWSVPEGITPEEFDEKLRNELSDRQKNYHYAKSAITDPDKQASVLRAENREFIDAIFFHEAPYEDRKEDALLEMVGI